MAFSKNDLPSSEEENDILITKRIATNLAKLDSLEETVMKDLKDLGNRILKANAELEKYAENKQEQVRLYMQLVNRKSDIVTNQDLSKAKEHIKRIQNSVEVKREIGHTLLELSDAYKEYHKTLDDLAKSTDKLNKKQKDWQDSAVDLSKAQSSDMSSGEKLDKLERKISKNKIKVIKQFDDTKTRDSFVETAGVRLNQVWTKLKNSIKNIAW